MVTLGEFSIVFNPVSQVPLELIWPLTYTLVSSTSTPVLQPTYRIN